MTTQKIIDAYKRAFALSNPPITINQGTKNEHQVFVPNCKRSEGKSQFYLREQRNRYMSVFSWEQDVWKICQPDAELANAVMDYASSLIA